MPKVQAFRKTLLDLGRARLASRLPVEQLAGLARQATAVWREVIARSRGARELTHRAVGRLVFSSTVGTPEPQPLPFIRVELWDRDRASAGDYLGASVTDAAGYFELAYDPRDAGDGDLPDLDLRVMESDGGQPRVLMIVAGADDVTEPVYDFGTIGVPYYEYHPRFPMPHILTFDQGKARLDGLPQSYPLGRKLALADSASRLLGVKLGHYLRNDLTLEQIQHDYRGRTGYKAPPNPWRGVNEDQAFVYRVLNGVCPSHFVRGPDGLYHVIRQWDDYEMDGIHSLPNVDACFRLVGRRLEPVSITLRERLDGGQAPQSPLGPARTWRPGDDGWSEARHDVLSNGYVHSQTAYHLGLAHFNVEQYALASRRHLRRNPLRQLLDPHTREVSIINTEAESVIFGEEGLVTQNSALTSSALLQAVCRALRSADWRGWRPRAPLTDDHDFAFVADLYWGVLQEYVGWFFARHREGIVAHWAEVHRFSRDLTAHSLPWERPQPPAGFDFVDRNELADAPGGRAVLAGVARSVSPLTQSERPAEGDLAQLAQLCAYVIYHATFWHSWLNDTSEALQPEYFQYNPVRRSTTRELTDQISVNLALSQTRYGLILRNEDGDIPDKLIELLRARQPQFARHSYDPGRIRSRINI